MKKIITYLVLSIVTLVSSQLMAQTNVTIVTYNILNFPNSGSDGSNATYGNAARTIYFRQIVEDAGADVIIIQELKSSAGADMLLNELNNNGTLGKTYARANTYTGYPIGNPDPLGNMLIYNTALFNLISETEVPRNSFNGQTAPRGNTHYVLRHPVNPTCPAQELDLHVFSTHLKASSGQPNEDIRDAGVQDLLTYINTNLSPNDNIVYGGDFNFYGTFEPAYTSLTTNAIAPFTDPIGVWVRNNNSEAFKYTQSTRTSNSQGNGGAPGGMDDRFDFLLFDNTIQSGTERVAYVPSSYKTWGNTNVPTNGEASDGNYIYEDELEWMSDHFPVLMQLELTAPTSLCGSTCPAIVHYGNPISSGIYNASMIITSVGTVNAGQNVSYFAGSYVELQPGFQVDLNADFCADIQSCFTEGEDTEEKAKDDKKEEH